MVALVLAAQAADDTGGMGSKAGELWTEEKLIGHDDGPGAARGMCALQLLGC